MLPRWLTPCGLHLLTQIECGNYAAATAQLDEADRTSGRKGCCFLEGAIDS